MAEAVRLVAGTLCVDHAKILELLPDGDRLLVRAGVGWREGTVGVATVGTNLESQAGYTLISDGPVICEDLREEIRFKGAPLLHEHGIISGVTVAIMVEGLHHGVLGAHTTGRRAFTEAEARFLEDLAGVLGAAVERVRADGRSRTRIAERTKRAEAAERRFEFLAEANALLSASPDYDAALTNAARLAVPALADWCFVDVIEAGVTVHRTAATLSGEDRVEVTRGRHPLDPRASHGTPGVLRSGRAELVSDPTEETLRAVSPGQPDRLPVARPGSFACVPLRVRHRTRGALGLLSSEGRRYGAEDLALAEGLAHCVALAVDSTLHHVPEARLVRELLDGAKRKPSNAASAGEPLGLTRRQLEVLRLLGDGKSARQISQELFRSEATVRNHIRAIKHALDARSQLEAVARARKLGLFPE